MSESVSRFQAEVAAVLEVLLKVAVVEITKVFEGRSVDSHGCTVDGEAGGKEELDCVPDIRAHMNRALNNLSDKKVCSVGVQVGETLLTLRQGTFICVNNHFSSYACSLPLLPHLSNSTGVNRKWSRWQAVVLNICYLKLTII